MKYEERCFVMAKSLSEVEVCPPFKNEDSILLCWLDYWFCIKVH